MKNCVVTGASSGIGEATVRLLREHGYKVYMGARREDRLRKLSGETGAKGHVLDVTDPASVRDFVRHLPEEIHVLVNNAGGALGLEPVCEMKEDDWLGMYQSNVLGTARMIREVFPRLSRSGDGSHVVNVGSIAAIETYLGGAGYTGAKHALRALTETLRLEWLGLPIRVMVFENRIDHRPGGVDRVLPGKQGSVSGHGSAQKPLVRTFLSLLVILEVKFPLISYELLSRGLDPGRKGNGRAGRQAETDIVCPIFHGDRGRIVEKPLGGRFELDEHFGGGNLEIFARPQIPRHVLPPPRVDEQPERAKGLDIGIFCHTRFVPVSVVLSPDNIVRRKRPHGVEHLGLFGLNSFIPLIGRWLHRQ